MFSGGGKKWAMSREEMKRNNRPASYISASELQRIKASTVIKDPADIEKERAEKEARRRLKHKKAQDRKDRMKQKEQRARARAKKSESELAEEAAKQVLLNEAADKRDEDNDAVKTLNTLAARAAAFTVRENQLKEREERLKREKEYDVFMEKKMELERLKDLRRREKEAQLKKKKRFEDREVLMVQIAEREAQRQRERKEVELEGEAMVRQIQKNKDAEEARLRRKMEIAKEKRVEIAKENDRAIERKKAVVRQAMQDDERVIAYQKAKAKELARLEAEEEERKQAAEMLCAKLRSEQERIMDNRAEMDQLRAKRYQEEADRKTRAKELAAEEHRISAVKMMQDARTAQMKMKAVRMAHEVRAQKKEYKDTVSAAWKAADREEKEREARHRSMNNHKAKLLEQIAEKERLRAQAGAVKLEEGRQLKAEFRLELAKLEHTREELIKNYKKQGIKDKYLSEMTRADMMKFQMR